MCCTINFHVFKSFKFRLEKDQNPWQVKRLVAIYVEGILFDNFHDDMKVGIVNCHV